MENLMHTLKFILKVKGLQSNLNLFILFKFFPVFFYLYLNHSFGLLPANLSYLLKMFQKQ